MHRDLDRRNDSLWRVTQEACLLWLIFVTVIQIPLDLLAVVDGYLMYMTPAELFHGVSLILLVDAAVIAAAAVVPSLLAGLLVMVRLVRTQTAVRWLKILHMTAFAILSAYWLARALKNWVASLFAVNDAVLWAAFTVLIGVPIVLAKLRRTSVLANLRARVLSLRTLAIIILLSAVAGVLSSDLSIYRYEELKVRERAPGGNARPNIILITVDTLAAQDMSLYGYPLETTLKLDRFAQTSHVFDHFFANSNFTTPAIVSMLTGRHVDTHRVFQLEGRLPAGAERQNLVQILSDAGYLTAAFVANPYAHPLHTRMSGSFDYLAVPPRRGAWGAMLGRVIRLTGINAQPLLDPLLPWLQPVLSRLAPEPDDITPFPAEAVFAQAQRFLDRHREAAPLFVWVHILPPHDPYLPPPPFLYSILPEKILDNRQATAGLEVNPPRAPQSVLDKLRLRYDEHVRYADSETGRFLDYLEANGHFRDSVIVVTADHGESFGRGWVNHNGPYLYQSLIHVPLIVHLPGQTRGSRISAFGQQVDIAPTLLETLSLQRGAWMEGVSLLPAMQGLPVTEQGPKYSMNLEKNSRFAAVTTGTIAVMADGYKYIRYLDRTRTPELYNLIDDPQEVKNLADSSRDLAGRFDALVGARLVK